MVCSIQHDSLQIELHRTKNAKSYPSLGSTVMEGKSRLHTQGFELLGRILKVNSLGFSSKQQTGSSVLGLEAAAGLFCCKIELKERKW